MSEVQDIVEIAVGGKSAGQVFEGDRRFNIVVRLPEKLRTDVEALKRIPIPLPRPDTSKTYESRGHRAPKKMRKRRVGLQRHHDVRRRVPEKRPGEDRPDPVGEKPRRVPMKRPVTRRR